MQTVMVFEYREDESHIEHFTTVDIDGEPWFVAADVCAVLGLTNVSDVLTALDEDEKQVALIPRAGQNRKVNLISESGLYALIFRSKKTSAVQFRKFVTKEVLPSIRKTGRYGSRSTGMPSFVVRFQANFDRIAPGFFSVMNELFIRVHGRLEHAGYVLPDKGYDGKEMRPDVSVGKLFAAYLKKHYPELASNHKIYKHKFPGGIEVDARQYPVELLPHYLEFIDKVWIPEHAVRYFKERDVKALNYLPKLLPPSSQSAS